METQRKEHTLTGLTTTNVLQVLKNKKGTEYVNKLFKCAVCEKSFKFRFYLERHLQIHRDSERYDCEKCNQTFTRQTELDRHVTDHVSSESETVKVCYVCDETFTNTKQLVEHQRTHNTAKIEEHQWTRIDREMVEHQRDPTTENIAEEQQTQSSEEMVEKRHIQCDIAAKPMEQERINDQVEIVAEQPNHSQGKMAEHQSTRNTEKMEENQRIRNDGEMVELPPEHTTENMVAKQRTHSSGKKMLSCDICDKQYSRKSHLRRHTFRIHTGDSTCLDSDKVFPEHLGIQSDEDRVDNLRIHSDRRIVEKHCPIYFELRRHVKVRGSGSLKHKTCACPDCDKKFYCNSELVKHSRVHTNEKPYSCSVCGKRFKITSNRNKHVLRYHGKIENDSKYVDRDKNSIAIVNNGTKGSESEERNEKRFPCPICGKLFGKKGSLNIHAKTHEKLTDEQRNIKNPYTCGKCDKRFPDYSHFIRHVNIHTGERPHECQFCTKSYTTFQHLKRHMAQGSHKDKKGKRKRNNKSNNKSECPVCGEEFDEWHQMRSHKKTHNLPRPFKCELCEKTYTSDNDLKQHTMRNHDNTKPFECGVCGLKVPYPSVIKQHMLTHQNEKPHSCDICGLRFLRRCQLTRHCNKHHQEEKHQNEKPHSCDICGLRFLRKCQLTRHCNKHHQAENPVCAEADIQAASEEVLYQQVDNTCNTARGSI